MLLMVIAVLGLGGVKGHEMTNNITRCDQLPRAPRIIPSEYQFNPIRVFFSMDPTFNCTSGLITGPGPFWGENTTFMMIQGDHVRKMFMVDQPITELQLTVTTTCDTGDVQVYYFMVWETVVEATRICPFACEDDGEAIKIFRCYGHTEADRDYMRAAIDKYAVNVTGYANITDMQVDCADALDESCEEYFI